MTDKADRPGDRPLTVTMDAEAIRRALRLVGKERRRLASRLHAGMRDSQSARARLAATERAHDALSRALDDA